VQAQWDGLLIVMGQFLQFESKKSEQSGQVLAVMLMLVVRGELER